MPEGLPARALPALQHEHALDRRRGARGARRVHLVRGAQARRRPRGDPVRAARRRAHLVASVALRPRPARGRRVALRAGQGRGRPGRRAGSDRRHLPRAARARRLIAISSRVSAAVRNLFGSCDAGRADDRAVRDHPACDQPAHPPQPRARRALRRARRGRRRRDRHDDQRAGDRSVRARLRRAGGHDARRSAARRTAASAASTCAARARRPPVVNDNVRPTAAGVWTTTLSVAAVSALTPRTCYLHAVPHGNAGTNRTAFPGKRVHVPALARDRRRRRPEQRRARTTSATGRRSSHGRSIWQSVSNCGLAGAATIDGRHVPLLGLGVPVRGLRRARSPPAARACSSTTSTPTRRTAPRRSSRARPTRSGCSRSQTSVEHRPEHRQRADPRDREPAALQPRPGRRAGDGADAARRSSRPASRLDRLIIQQGDGRQALVTDTWSATDGRHHQIDVFYEHRLGGTAPVVSFPWAGGFTVLSAGLHAEAARDRAVQLLHARVRRARPTATSTTRRARSRCRTARRRCASAPARALWTQYVRTLTPETPTHISFGFSWATAQADLTTLIGQAERALGPTHCLVPNVVGRTLTDAKRLLLAGPLQGRQGQVRDLELRRKGRVIQQGRRAVDDARGRQRRDAARQLAPDRRRRSRRSSTRSSTRAAA